MTEMQKFRKMLDEKGIAWFDDSSEWMTRTKAKDGSFSVICGVGSYGYKGGLLEVWSNKTTAAANLEEGLDEVVGYLTAEDVFDYI